LVALLGLNILEGLSLADHPPQSLEHLHMMVEVAKLAYADRDRWIGDPAHAKMPVAGLLSKPYAARRRSHFDPSKARAHAFGNPEGDTTGFVVADERGNLISVIQSLFNAFGSGVITLDAQLQNRGRHFSMDPSHPAALVPGKRPFHTLMACIATRDNRPVLGFATMGAMGRPCSIYKF
jgi:gamma-glutamyltranspeptidase/glutathione hydrolase